MERLIFHVDVNNAFLSWEALHRIRVEGEEIDLRQIPSAIGGDPASRHGIILAKSMPAKAFGVRTAETLNDARKKCPELTIVPPRMHLYRQYSRQLIALFKEYSSCIEQFSIDEAFLDMTDSADSKKTPFEMADELRAHISDRLGFTVNIGVSSNKLLAKMASDFEKPDKVHTLFPCEIQKKMWPLPVRELFSVGKSTQKTLYNLGIRTIGELAMSDRAILHSHLGKHGNIIHDYANGIDNAPVEAEAPDNKVYGNSTTLSHDVTDLPEAKKVLLSLCETVGSRLRKDRMLANVVAVSIKDASFRKSSHQCTLTAATNSTAELYDRSCELFLEFWDGAPIRLIGVSTSKLTRDTQRQLNLLDQDKYIRQEKLDSAIDRIREQFGESAIMRASFLEKEPGSGYKP